MLFSHMHRLPRGTRRAMELIVEISAALLFSYLILQPRW